MKTSGSLISLKDCKAVSIERMVYMENKSRADKAVELFKEGYNCSQAVFAAFSDIYGIDTNTALRISASFGAGMGRMREVCGALTGAFMIAGLENGTTDARDFAGKKANYDLVNLMAQDFKAEFGSIICRELLGLSKNPSEVSAAAVDTTPEPRTEEYYKKRPCVENVRYAAQLIEERILSEKRAADGDIKLRRVESPDDVTKISDMAHKIWREHYIDIIGAEQVEYMLDRFQSEEAVRRQMVNENYEYFIIEAKGEEAGYCAVQISRDKKKMFISKLYLYEECRRMGIGTQTVKELAKIAKDDGCGAMWLTVNKNNSDAIRAYEASGFSITDSVVTHIGGGFVMDDYIMMLEV